MRKISGVKERPERQLSILLRKHFQHQKNVCGIQDNGVLGNSKKVVKCCALVHRILLLIVSKSS